MTEPLSFGERLKDLERTSGLAPALTLCRQDGSQEHLTFSELCQWSTNVGWMLREAGVSRNSTVVVSLGNSLEHFVTAFAAWQLGALVLPLNSQAVERERLEVLALLEHPVVAGDAGANIGFPVEDLLAARYGSRPSLPDAVPDPGKAVCSGGSTGRPKIIIDTQPMAKLVGASMGKPGDVIRFHEARRQLVPGALFHNMPFTWSAHGLFEGQHVFVLERFDPALLVETIERGQVEFMTLVPTMMRRIAELPDIERSNFSSLLGVMHSGAPCSAALKRRWIDLVGADVLYEAFGSTEGVGMTIVRGDDWLKRPGTVGRPVESSLKILNNEGHEVEAGVIGEIFMRHDRTAIPFRYLGEDAKAAAHGEYVSVGDMGYVDEEGFLFPADRRLDLILSGGVNIYPAAIEAVLLENPSVADAVVFGLPDTDWGQRVHAVVVPQDGCSLDHATLDTWCRHSLASYKVPKGFEIVDALPRDEAGKIRRRAMIEDRAQQSQA